MRTQNSMETVGFKINDVYTFNVYNPPCNNLDVTLLTQMAPHRKDIFVEVLTATTKCWKALQRTQVRSP